MQVNGSPAYTTLQKTADNYFLLFSAIAIQLPAAVEMTSVLGDIVYDTLVATSVTSPPFAGLHPRCLPVESFSPWCLQERVVILVDRALCRSR